MKPNVHIVKVNDTPVKLVDAREGRVKLSVSTSTAGGVLIGLDEAMTRDQHCFLVPQNTLFYTLCKEEMYVLNPTAATEVTVYYFDE